jgi:hypothetical protein
MVSFLAHNRQCTITGVIVLLMLLATLLPALNPALAQSCPTPTVRLSAHSAKWGDVVTMEGEGWLPGRTVEISTDTGPEEEEIVNKSVKASNNGKWAESFKVHAPPSDYELVFAQEEGECRITVTKSFSVNDPTISLDPKEGHAGMTVTVRGSGWIKENQISIQFLKNRQGE